MKNRPMTISDIAEALGVSTTTVHKVIYNKKGVGEQTRERIRSYIQEHDFQINQAASALKRRQIRIAYVGVEVESDFCYYKEICAGVEAACQNVHSFQIRVDRYLTGDSGQQQLDLLEKLYREKRDVIDGLIVTCVHEYMISPAINQFAEDGIPVVVLASDAKNSLRNAYICSDSTLAGRIAGELIASYELPEKSQVLLVGGSSGYSNHRQNVDGFLSQLHAYRPDLDVIDIYHSSNADELEGKIVQYLQAFPKIRAIYSVTGRGTRALLKGVRAAGASGKLKVVGSDVAPEFREYFEDRTLTASIFQNPRGQGQRAVATLYRLIMGEQNVGPIQMENISIVINSNKECYL